MVHGIFLMEKFILFVDKNKEERKMKLKDKSKKQFGYSIILGTTLFVFGMLGILLMNYSGFEFFIGVIMGALAYSTFEVMMCLLTKKYMEA